MATTARLRLPPLLLRLPAHPWMLAGAAFGMGLLLFLVVWLAIRSDDAPVGPAPPTAAAPAFEPLPAPMAAGEAATPIPVPEDAAAQLIEEPAPAPPAPAEPVAADPLPPPLDAAAPATSTLQPPALLPDQPSPRYPASALRRGESGTVMLQVEVDALGHPVRVQVVGASGSRALDRAAADAVSRWQFQAARDASGAAVAGVLTIPVEFNAR